MGFSEADYITMQARLNKNRPPESEPESVTVESVLHDKIIAECRYRHWPYIHSRMDRASTIALGAPDFVIFLEAGRVVSVECKTKTGKLTTRQLYWKMYLEKNGHEHYVVRSMKDFWNAISRNPKSSH
jgi:hypothetical protein